MIRRGVRHLVVVDPDGGFANIVSQADLFSLPSARASELVDAIAQENRQPSGKEAADREFHLSIARATRNAAIVDMIDRLWRQRATSASSAHRSRVGEDLFDLIRRLLRGEIGRAHV